MTSMKGNRSGRWRMYEITKCWLYCWTEHEMHRMAIEITGYRALRKSHCLT